MKPILTTLCLFLMLIGINTKSQAQQNLKHSIYIKDKKCYPQDYFLYNFFQHSQGSLYALSNIDKGQNIDAQLVKLTPSLDTAWTKTYSGSKNDNFTHIKELKNGNMLLCGGTNSYDGDVWYGRSNCYSSIWLMEVDTNGNIIKGKCFGSSNGDAIRNTIVSKDGESIYVTGMAFATDFDFVRPGFGGFDFDAYLVKLDTAFNIQWARFIIGNDLELGIDLVEVSPNKIVVGVPTSSTNSVTLNAQAKGGPDVLLWCVDSNGNDVWKKRYGSTGVDGGNFNYLLAKNNSIYYITEHGPSDGDIDYSTTTYTGGCWVLKLDTLGNKLASKSYGGTTGVGAKNMENLRAIVYEDNIWVAGKTTGGDGVDVDVNINPITYNVWLGMLDSNLNLIGKYTVNGNWGDETYDYFIYNNELHIELSASGYFPNSESCSTTTTDSIFQYVVKLGKAPLCISENNKIANSILFELYPNPTQSNIYWQLIETGKHEVVIRNQEGKIVFQTKSKKTTEQLNCSQWTKGIYYLTITQNKKMQTKQFIIN